jgi:PKD repeat protein
LSGANEVPPVVSSGAGALSFMFDPATNRLTYHGSVSGLNSNVTAAHIHTGFSGTSGGVLYPLSYITTTNGATFSGVVTVTQSDVNALLTSGLYANVHTTSSPGGEVRGQINVGWLGMTDSQGRAVTHFTTDTPGPVTFYAFAGDVVGSASVTFVQPPDASFAASDVSVTVSQAITFTNMTVGTAPLSYLWNFGDTTTSTLTSPTHIYTQTGAYTVTLTASNAYGTDSASLLVLVKPHQLYLPVIRR